MTNDTTSGQAGSDDTPDTQDELTRSHAIQTDTTDAVAGETVLPGLGYDDDAAVGDATSEPEPEYRENDLAGEEIDLDDQAD